jgi:hypothetical protein
MCADPSASTKLQSSKSSIEDVEFFAEWSQDAQFVMKDISPGIHSS